MEELSNKEIKQVQLDILNQFDEYCKINNLKYSLTFGTLLGAIRHKGYIPWDDDIDVMMPRPDYMKFINSFNGAVENIRVVSIYNNKNYPYPYAKVENTKTRLIEFSSIKYEIGINIDIFPLDGVPSDNKRFSFYFKKIKFLRNILAIKTIKTSSSRNIYRNSFLILLKIVCAFISYQYIVQRIEKEILKFEYENSEYLMNPCINSKASFRAHKEIFEHFCLVNFENKQYLAISEYDKYLTILFGDYMKLPPLDQRASHHAYKAYRR